MRQRLFVLTAYFLRSLLFSLPGLLYVILALVFWAIFFPPGQATPDLDNYVIVVGAFGAVLTFLATLTIAGRGNRAENYPLIVRLPSRVEYVTAVLLAGALFAFLLQLLVALLGLISGPAAGLSQLLFIPPLWIAPNVLAAILALHASDLVAAGWSRVIVYGVLALLLVGQSLFATIARWTADLLNTFSGVFYNQGLVAVADLFSRLSAWLRGAGGDLLGQIVSAVFWPFHALVEAITNGYFTPAQALAPAVLILYATILFLLAADLFATKDLELTE